MWAYIVRRILWTIPIVLGVMLLTFTMFTLIAKDPARQYAGKFATPQVLQSIRHQMGLDKPVWFNRSGAKERGWTALFDSQFCDVLFFRFQPSMRYGEPVRTLFWRKAPVSLAIQLPVFIIELGIQLVLALFVATNRGRWPDYVTTFLAILGMSLPALSIYLGAQWLFAAHWRIFPVAGWDVGFYAVQFAVLPIIVSVLGGIGGGTRFYRTVVLEEINADYVRTARAKGLSENRIMWVHVLRNASIPIITHVMATLPGLLIGAFLVERFFSIPGIGREVILAVERSDFPVIKAITVYVAVATMIFNLLADLMYKAVDPRVQLK